MTVTKAQKAATAKYESKKYDKILIRMPKGQKQRIDEHIAITGESLNGFVNRAINEALDKK